MSYDRDKESVLLRLSRRANRWLRWLRGRGVSEGMLLVLEQELEGVQKAVYNRLLARGRVWA